MKFTFSATELETLCAQLERVFDSVAVVPVAPFDDAEKGATVEYSLEEHATSCTVSRTIIVEGETKQLQLTNALTPQGVPCAEMTARELQMHNDDLIRDFLTGVYNRHYWDTTFCPTMATRKTAVAVISIDGFDAIAAARGEAGTNQLLCYVANQWKKYYDETDEKIVSRLSHHTFAVACVGADELDLESQMRYLYEKMHCTCTTTCGMLAHIPFTLSIGCASTEEVQNNTWTELCALCTARLHRLAATGGNGVAYAELV